MSLMAWADQAVDTGKDVDGAKANGEKIVVTVNDQDVKQTQRR
jgi:hypothetical protein